MQGAKSYEKLPGATVPHIGCKEFYRAVYFSMIASSLVCVVWVLMSLVSVAMYFNEEGVLGELEEVAADSVLALRNAVQYLRLAIFLKNRSDQPTTIGRDIDFEQLPGDPDDEWELMLDDEQELMLDEEREMMLDAGSGTVLGSDEDEEIRIV
uniref:Uncharacterized protein n=1 Tax=Hyaloperonospora arabidopsidis (strain Emoy2) TaxID=559515 RepID=M4B6U4_HYAAE